MGVSDWAKFGEDGQEVGNPVFPYRLRFQVLSHNLDINLNINLNLNHNLNFNPNLKKFNLTFARSPPARSRSLTSTFTLSQRT